MAQIQADDEGTLLVFTEEEIERFGLEVGMKLNFEIKDTFIQISLEKHINQNKALNFLNEILLSVEHRPWISYIIDEKINISRAKKKNDQNESK